MSGWVSASFGGEHGLEIVPRPVLDTPTGLNAAVATPGLGDCDNFNIERFSFCHPFRQSPKHFSSGHTAVAINQDTCICTLGSADKVLNDPVSVYICACLCMCFMKGLHQFNAIDIFQLLGRTTTMRHTLTHSLDAFAISPPSIFGSHMFSSLRFNQSLSGCVINFWGSSNSQQPRGQPDLCVVASVVFGFRCQQMHTKACRQRVSNTHKN